jgi:hypothetical protein
MAIKKSKSLLTGPVRVYNPGFRRYVLSRLAVCFFLSLGLFGCAGTRVQEQLESRLTVKDYAGGLEVIDKAQGQYAGVDALLYYFDKGSFEQRAGNYPVSNQDLEQAELLIDDLYDKSITEGMTSFLVNDMTMAYAGEDFEQVAVNILKTLNYLYLGDLQGAQIEARKVNNRLLTLSDKYGKEAIYKEDAFARYLSAFAYEAGGEYNDAYLDYKNAYQAFEWYHAHFGMDIPPFIQADLLRLSRWLGFDDEYQQWREKFGESLPEPERRPVRQSEVLLVIYDGLMPPKRTRFVEAPVLDETNHPYLLKVAFPVIKPRQPALAAVRCQSETGVTAEGYVVQPQEAIAIKNLNQRIGLITVKAIARATAKYIASVQARKAARTQGEGVGLLVALATNVYSVVSEQADTRCWRTLPNRFAVIRMPMPPGRHELTIQLESFHGGARPNETMIVELKKGEKKVIPLYIPQ